MYRSYMEESAYQFQILTRVPVPNQSDISIDACSSTKL